MTTIAVKRQGDLIKMSCDSQTTRGMNKHHADNSQKIGGVNGKIAKINGMLIGTAGNSSESILMFNFVKNHKPDEASCDSLMEFFLEFRIWVSRKTGKSDYALYNDYLIVIGGKIFEVMTEFLYFREIKDFWAIGSGGFLAISALHLGKDTHEAVEVATKYDVYSSGDIISETI